MNLHEFKRAIKPGDTFTLQGRSPLTVPFVVPEYCYTWATVVAVTPKGIELGSWPNDTQVWLCFWPNVSATFEDEGAWMKVTFYKHDRAQVFHWVSV